MEVEKREREVSERHITYYEENITDRKVPRLCPRSSSW